jgi:SAM-dependent methyltransferase
MPKHQPLYDLIVGAGSKNKNIKYFFERWLGSKECLNTKDLFEKVRSLEKEALSFLDKNDRILDIGAGAGRISIYLKKKGFQVVSLEKSKIIYQVLRKRGLKNVINKDIFKYFPKKKYNIALLFRVHSLFGVEKKNIIKLFEFLSQKIICNNGKLLLSSNEPMSGNTRLLKRRFIFNGQVGPWFKSLHPSFQDVVELSGKCGFKLEKSKKDESNQYFLLLSNRHYEK